MLTFAALLLATAAAELPPSPPRVTLTPLPGGAAWTLASGRTVWPVFERIWTARGAWFLGLAMLLAWGYKAVIMKWG